MSPARRIIKEGFRALIARTLPRCPRCNSEAVASERTTPMKVEFECNCGHRWALHPRDCGTLQIPRS